MYQNHLVLILRLYISNAPIASCNWLISALVTLNGSGIIYLLLTLSWFVMECLWKFSYVVREDFFKHIGATFLISDSNPDNHNRLILYFHNEAYNDPRCAFLCDWQFFQSIFGSFYLQFSHHYVHNFIVTYLNSLLLFGHYSFIACKAFGCFSHWVPLQQLNVSILFMFL